MTQALLAKRMHLVALAALLAMVAALFAALPSATADGHEHITLSVGDSDNVVSDDQQLTLTITVNNRPVPDVGTAIVSDAYQINWVAVPAALPVTSRDSDAGDDFTDVATATGNSSNSEWMFYVPKGLSGDYTISAQVSRANTDDADGTTEGRKVLNGSIKITVGDAGTDIAAATISLGKVGHATTKTARTDAAATAAYGDSEPNRYEACADNPEVANDLDTDDNGTVDDTVNANCIALTISVTNSLGNAANGGDITAIHVFAPLATIIYDSDATDAPAAGSEDIAPGVTGDSASGTAQLAGGSASAKIFIAKEAAGTVSVNAIVLGTKGSTTSESITLTFTGTADSISVTGPDSALSQNGTAYVAPVADNPDTADVDETVVEVESEGEARLEVTAVDASGNVATLTPEQIDVEIVDADDDVVATIGWVATQQVDAKGNTVHTAVRITLNATDAAPGTYTVNVTFGDNDPVSVEVVVAGKVAGVEVSSSQDTVAIGDIVTVTATVSDADGNLSPDIGAVRFQAVGALKLSALGDGADGGVVSVDLDDGSAAARFVVIDGAGTATIIASSGGVDGVTSVSTAPVVVEPEPEPEPEVHDSSGLASQQLNSFTSWTASNSTTASQVFASLAGRGATSIQLWNGSAWLRYSMVDGAMVPGSIDFTIMTGDVLYTGG